MVVVLNVFVCMHKLGRQELAGPNIHDMRCTCVKICSLCDLDPEVPPAAPHQQSSTAYHQGQVADQIQSIGNELVTDAGTAEFLKQCGT